MPTLYLHRSFPPWKHKYLYFNFLSYRSRGATHAHMRIARNLVAHICVSLFQIVLKLR